MQVPDLIRSDFYSQVASRYDECVSKAGYTAPARVSHHAVALYGKPHARVLDLACGTGLGSLAFFEAGFDVIGIDFAPGMLAIAKSHPYKMLCCQNIENELQVPDESFDIVTAIGVTEFVTNLAQLLKRIGSKLRNNGLCALTFPRASGATRELKIRSYTLEEFQSLLDPKQLEVVDVVEFFGYESGHLGLFQPRLRVDYCAVFLRKLPASSPAD